MKTPFKLFPLFLCLWLLPPTAKASFPLQSDFEFLEPFNDTTLVESGLELTGSIAGVSLSALLNLGIWWGVCITTKMDSCLQLASVVTTAEVALAGHVSPWPLEEYLWRYLYFVSAGMAAYAGYIESKNKIAVPVAVLTYLAAEAESRTVASATSTLILKDFNSKDIATEKYAEGERVMFSMASGYLIGAVVYEALAYKGLSPEKATLASVVSAAIGGTLSWIFSVSPIDVNDYFKAKGLALSAAGAITAAAAGAKTGTNAKGAVEVGAAAAAIAGAAVGAGAAAKTRAKAGAKTGPGGLGTVYVEAGGAVYVGAAAKTGAKTGPGGLGAVHIGLVAGSGIVVVRNLMQANSKIASNHPLNNAGVTLALALTFALINSLSNYAIYGYPLEDSLSETAWTPWKKFYAPLDYLSILFK